MAWPWDAEQDDVKRVSYGKFEKLEQAIAVAKTIDDPEVTTMVMISVPIWSNVPGANPKAELLEQWIKQGSCEDWQAFHATLLANKPSDYVPA